MLLTALSPARLLRSTALPTLALLLAAPVAAPGALAQQDFASPPPPAANAAPLPDSLAWVPQGMDALARQASWHTDMTFDRSMLALAGNVSSLDAPTRQALARLNGISVHSYKFRAPGSYDPATLDVIRAQYAALGWKHIVAHAKPGELGYAAGQTDLWIDTKGVNVAGGAVLLSGPSSVNLIAISGDLSTLDLLHLRGHFGIPDFSDNAVAH